MGQQCCGVTKKLDPGEEFIRTIIYDMEVNTLKYKHLKEIVFQNASPDRKQITKTRLEQKVFPMLEDKDKKLSHYQKKIFNLVLAEFPGSNQPAFALFLLYGFLNHDEEDTSESLYEIFQLIIGNSPLTYGKLEYYTIEYVLFYTLKLNNCILNNLLPEHSAYEAPIRKLNDVIYSQSNLKTYVNRILNGITSTNDDRDQNEEIPKQTFLTFFRTKHLDSFAELRDEITSYFSTV